MKKAIGVKEFLNKKFKTLNFEDKWKSSFGDPEDNFSAIVYGMSGNGKTDFCLQFAKMLSKFDKVYYNSYEQGISKSLQEGILRQQLPTNGRIVFGHMEDFEQIKERLDKKKSPKFVFIDSRDYMDLTITNFKEILSRYPKKCFIVVCHEEGAKPKGNHGKAIEYRCDIKIRVKGYISMPRSRYGGNEDFVIWEQGAERYKEKLKELKQQKKLELNG